MDMSAAKHLDDLVMRGIRLRREAMVAAAKLFGLKLPPVTEDERIADMKGRAAVPESCGPEIPLAPARGRLVAVPVMARAAIGDGYELGHAGFRGRDAARAADAFDQMALQARRAGGFDPFTKRQKLAGRTYAALVERHSAVGLKGRSVETMSGGGGGSCGDGIIDLILDEGRTIDRLRAAIGDGWALEIRRASKRRRVPLTVLELVDRVCLSDEAIGTILKAAGWAAGGETMNWAQTALADALDRMADVANLGA